jgi:hypothetical protein
MNNINELKEKRRGNKKTKRSLLAYLHHHNNNKAGRCGIALTNKIKPQSNTKRHKKPYNTYLSYSSKQKKACQVICEGGNIHSKKGAQQQQQQKGKGATVLDVASRGSVPRRWFDL